MLKTSLAGDDISDPPNYTAPYTYDDHGSMLTIHSIPGGLTWDPQDRLQKTEHLGGGDVYYVYDSAVNDPNLRFTGGGVSCTRSRMC